ncbi:MAG: hypothetical protein RMN52_05265, partial [Anaerolineae bacterium]|nr:hypothetical protein [Candidatus Roseilinea sp.]MDW8449394.1 hypothetical protein [Anaerolineae bacterium]
MYQSKIYRPTLWLTTAVTAFVVATGGPAPSRKAVLAITEETTSPSSVAASSLPGVHFLHVATSANISGHSTYIDHPALNGNPGAIFLVTQNWNPGGVGGTYNSNPIGVWYNALQNKWAVFNQNLAAMPPGAAFNVFVPAAGSHVFVHTATAGNISGNSTMIDHPLLNNNPNALVLVTQNFNPGGGGGTYNNKHIGVWYTGTKWAIFNQDLAAMPTNASFNVVVAGSTAAVVHTATAENSSAQSTFIDHPLLNGNPNAIFAVTPNWNPGGVGGTYNNRAIGVFYLNAVKRWAVFNQNLESMPAGASFNVLLPDTRADVFVHTATAGNTAGASNQYTFIDHPMLNNNPNAVFFVTQNWNPNGASSGTYNDRPIGVFYANTAQKWAIFNQSVTAMPAGADFNVLIPPPGANVFIHTATAGNTTGHVTRMDHPLLNNNPNAKVLVTQSWNPGGIGGTYNNHPIGVYFSSVSNRWIIFNQDIATMPVDASFNVMVLNDLTALPWSEDAFVHTATSANTTGNWTALNHPLTNGVPPAFVFITDNWNPGGVGGTYNNHNT